MPETKALTYDSSSDFISWREVFELWLERTTVVKVFGVLSPLGVSTTTEAYSGSRGGEEPKTIALKSLQLSENLPRESEIESKTEALEKVAEATCESSWASLGLVILRVERPRPKVRSREKLSTATCRTRMKWFAFRLRFLGLISGSRGPSSFRYVISTSLKDLGRMR